MDKLSSIGDSSIDTQTLNVMFEEAPSMEQSSDE